MFMPTYLLYVQHILYLSQLMCIIFSHLDHWHGFCQIFLQESQLLAWIFSYSPPSALSLAAPPTILCLFFWKPPKILSKKKQHGARKSKSPNKILVPAAVCDKCVLSSSSLRHSVLLQTIFLSTLLLLLYTNIYLCFKCISWNSLY